MEGNIPVFSVVVVILIDDPLFKGRDSELDGTECPSKSSLPAGGSPHPIVGDTLKYCLISQKWCDGSSFGTLTSCELHRQRRMAIYKMKTDIIRLVAPLPIRRPKGSSKRPWVPGSLCPYDATLRSCSDRHRYCPATAFPVNAAGNLGKSCSPCLQRLRERALSRKIQYQKGLALRVTVQSLVLPAAADLEPTDGPSVISPEAV